MNKIMHSSTSYANNASPAFGSHGLNDSSPPSSSFLDVHRIEDSGSAGSDSVVMVKLTDEIFAALEQCQRSGKPVKIRIDEQGGVWTLGEGSSASQFQFQKQSLPGELTDTLVQNPNGSVRNVGVYKTKYQIQATANSFEATRKKAEKRAEEEKNRGTKHVKNHKKEMSSSSSSRLLSSSMSRPTSSSALQRVSPPMKNSSSMPSAQSTSANAPKTLPKVDPLKGELMRKGLKKRVIHLVVTQRFKGWQEVYEKLRADGLPDGSDSPRRIEDCIRDVSEFSGDRLSLRTALYSEVDPRWPFYTQDEKTAVRKLLAASNGVRAAQTDAASFAPMRKSGIERMRAGGTHSGGDRHNNTTQLVSPESIPTPPMSRPASGGSNTTKSTAPRESPLSDDDPSYQTAIGVKRKAHVPSSAATASNTTSSEPPSATASAEKRPRRHESASPPEDPTTTSAVKQLASLPPRFNVGGVVVNGGGGGSTASSRISSPASSLSSPSQPSCDWEKTFAEIKNVTDAERYFSMFHREYPAYMECYRILTEVSREFRDLEQKLKIAGKSGSGKDVTQIERDIQHRFSQYEKDPEFLRARQRHTDLRSKLAVLKSRISTWEHAQERALSA